MHRAVALAALAMGAPVLGGCVAAALPALAAGAMARSQGERGQVDAAQPATAEPATLPEEAAADSPERDPSPLAGTADGAATTTPALPAMARDVSFTGGFGAFLSHAQLQMQRRGAGESPASVVLVRNFSLDRPEYVACGDRPPAVMIDLDDAVLGTEPVIDTAPTGWEAASGLAEGLARMRDAGLAILWLTDAPFYQLDEIRTRMRETGLDTDGRDPVYAQRGSSDRKQLRRLDAAGAWCIIAAAGDRQADLDEVYDYLIRPEAAVQLDRLWDRGWFMTPAPIQRTPPATTP